MFKQGKRGKNPPIKRDGSQGFPDGLNTIAHSSTLKNTELAELINGIYSQYGTISKRLGTTVLGEETDGSSKIMQLGKAYKIGDTDYFIRISDLGIPEYYDFTTQAWTDLSADEPDGYSGTTPEFTDGVPTFDTTME